MVALARARLASQSGQVRLWVGDVSAIGAPDATYDAVFDFGIIHHVPQWRHVLREVERVLKPGDQFYAEEVLGAFTGHPIACRLFDHPQTDRFDATAFGAAIQEAGLAGRATEQLWGAVAWFTATTDREDIR
jgi:ubiquinone/menaquinone biosynthesis C-methylase UbiE